MEGDKQCTGRQHRIVVPPSPPPPLPPISYLSTKWVKRPALHMLSGSRAFSGSLVYISLGPCPPQVIVGECNSLTSLSCQAVVI